MFQFNIFKKNNYKHKVDNHELDIDLACKFRVESRKHTNICSNFFVWKLYK